MKKVLIYKDNSRVRDFQNSLERIKGPLAILYQNLKGWPAENIEWNIEDLASLANQASTIEDISPSYVEAQAGTLPRPNVAPLKKIIIDLAKDKIIQNESETKVFGLKLSKSKLMDLMEDPIVSNELVEALAGVKNYARNSFKSALNPKYFVIDNIAVDVNQKAWDEFVESCNYYATTTAEIAMTEKIVEVCEALNAFTDYIGKWQGAHPPMFENRALFLKNGKYYPDYQYIKATAK